MKNIFENAYFGKAYKTRDDKKAIYIGSTYKNDHALHIDKNGSNFSNDIYNDNGKMVNNKSQANTPYDIVSEWQEINEEELDRLAEEYSLIECTNIFDESTQEILEIGFEAGYLKALEL